VTEALDSGPALAQARVPILPGDTEDTLAARVLVEEHRIYAPALAAHIRQLESLFENFSGRRRKR
jgi:phosphoribosylglycinamide formyltransferase 1